MAAEQLKPPVERLCRSMTNMLEGEFDEAPTIRITIARGRNRRRRKRTRQIRKATQAIQIMAAAAMTMWIGSGALEWAFSPIHTTFL